MANRLKFTKQKKKEFLAELSKDANATRAAQMVGIVVRTVYQHKTDDPEFAEAFEEAVQIGTEALIDECRRRAMGFETDVFDKDGNQTGTKFNASDTLAMFLIKARRPEYRDKFIDIPTGSNFHLTMDFGKPEDKE